MSNEQNSTVSTSALFRSLTWPFRWLYWLAVFLLLSWGMAVLIGVLFHAYIWAGQGEPHFERIYASLLYDSVAAARQFPGDTNAAMLTYTFSAAAYNILFVYTGLEDALFKSVHGVPADGWDSALYGFLKSHTGYIFAIMWSTKLWGAKLALLITAAPLFLLAFVVGVTDGLVLRHIRTEGGGRESSFIHHRSKFFVTMAIGTTFMGILLIPFEMPSQILLPSLAAIVGLLVRLQWQFYKKYL